MLSFEYGWTTEYIFNLTMSEIVWRVKSIYKRKTKDNVFAAKLHDKEMKGSMETISDDDRDHAFELAKKRMEERRK